MLTCHCSFTPKELDEFTYVEYKDCIAELAIRLQYSAISHVLANPYAGEQGSEMVTQANPFNIKDESAKKAPPKVTFQMLSELGLMK